MFPRLALLSFIFNNALLKYLALPFGLLALVCVIATLILMRKDDPKPDTNIKLGNPVNIFNAIGFGVVYILLLYAVFYSEKILGESGLCCSALIADLKDTDAITISMAKFSLDGEQLKLASSVIIEATSNVLVKLGITLFKASKPTGKFVSYAFGSVILLRIISILVSRG
ncbi:MAG: uncharacterized membrane protein (DUF4010 family) [Psychroserpens sp.]|jgi:uncharacterized membrane protein (DUF4010 family)|uniref:DUF4010 domain-containing protein n=1 Tax=Psychroserpens sp. TaxID=2020870 RepID=UPI0039E357E4